MFFNVNFQLHAHLIAFLFLIVKSFLIDCSPVRVVALVVPSSVRTGAAAELSCLYELGNSSLYSLKWFYRANETDLDEQEFFRYTPSIRPHKQYFPIDGINVNMNKCSKSGPDVRRSPDQCFHLHYQVNKSTGDRVVLESTSGQTSGKYKCEISVDGTFQTVAAEKLMTVMGNGVASSLSFHPLLLLVLLSILHLDLASNLLSKHTIRLKNS